MMRLEVNCKNGKIEMETPIQSQPTSVENDIRNYKRRNVLEPHAHAHTHHTIVCHVKNHLQV
jgi:hypothetical protein